MLRLLQQGHGFYFSIQIDGAAVAIFQSAVAGSYFGHFVAGGAGVLVGRAGHFPSAVEDDPARGGGQKISQAGHRKTMFMDQLFDA